MRRFLITAIVVLVLPVTAMVGCGGKDEHQHVADGTASKPATQPSSTANATAIDWCIVSGETLGSMGDPISYKYKDREVTFCCKSCVKQFEANPLGYLARLDSAQAGKLKQPGHEGHSH